MPPNKKQRLHDEQISTQIRRVALKIGADLVGFASITDLRTAPSFRFAPKMPGIDEGVGVVKSSIGLVPGKVRWPKHAKTIVTIALHHAESEPELDWRYGLSNSIGNRRLIRIVRELRTWMQNRFKCRIFPLPYQVEEGGTYLKDAAVYSALGCIGKNNLLINPTFGPRIRLRSFGLDTEIPSDGVLKFAPCKSCGEYCRKACPKDAFSVQFYNEADFGQKQLPAQNGDFARTQCNLQMQEDENSPILQKTFFLSDPVKIIKYCRRCELACPVGKNSMGEVSTARYCKVAP